MQKPEHFSDLPPAFQEYLHGVYVRAGAAIGAAIESHGPKPGLSSAVARARIAILDAELAPVGALLAQNGVTVACRKGCAVCCTHTIETTPDEVFAVADYLAATLDAEALAALKARASAADAALKGLPTKVARHARQVFCPVLDPATGSCLAHPVRPNACQGYLSVDLAKCQANYENPPQPVEQPTVAPMITSVVDSTRSYALEDLGAPTLSIELIAGLLAAWAEPDAEARWLAGEAIFPDARSLPV